MPASFGRADTLRKHGWRGAQTGVWKCLFQAVLEPDLDWLLLDSNIIRAHAQAAGGPQSERF
ncbi:MAG: hypothetical protein NVS3B25_15410 [Hymenobacter sp.]